MHTHDEQSRQILTALFDILGELKHRATEREDPATVFLLRHLSTDPPRRVSDLAECVRLDASTVSRHVKALDDAGHLTRIEDPDDRRASRLMITERGSALLEAAMGARAGALAEGLEDWPEHDRRTLATLITRLAQSLGHKASVQQATHQEPTDEPAIDETAIDQPTTEGNLIRTESR